MIDLASPLFWIRPDALATVAELRRRAPVFRHDTAHDGPLWSVLSYAESIQVLSDPIFSSQRGSLLGSDPATPPAGAGKMMALSDPPQHRHLRDPVVPFFASRYLDGLRGRIGQLVSTVVTDALRRREVDFVHDVATVVPLTVMCELVGVPEPDRADVLRACDTAFAGPTEGERRSSHQRLLSYLFGLAVKRRADLGTDMITALLTAHVQGRPFGLDEVVLTCDNIIVGGVQTVRHAASLALNALLEDPGAWAVLADASTSIPVAVEELLRWTSVSVHVMRTATRDIELGGRTIRAGDRVVVWPPAANRDEKAFPQPDRLDLARQPNRHLALGWGPHYCIGAGLARLELSLLFAELAGRVAHVERLAPPIPRPSIINLGLDSLRVRLHPAPVREPT